LHLGADQPFFAIPPHGLDGRSLPPTIEAMAADRVRALRAYQPDGPYRLGGFCWGGFLALEMARQIQEQGGEVDALMLIDSDPKRAGLRPVRRLCRRIGSWLSLSEETELALFGLYRRMADAWNRVDDVAGRFEILLTKSMRLFARPNTGEVESGVSSDRVVPANRHARWSTYHKITQNYVPEPYTGDVILYRSSRLEERHPVDPRGGWRFVTPDLELCSIEGDHWTCVTKHVKDVAAKMSSYLKSRTRRN
jgi:thioesterase domain-containing protein